jgi:clan AA aspartic protease (TIGR02281 family)
MISRTLTYLALSLLLPFVVIDSCWAKQSKLPECTFYEAQEQDYYDNCFGAYTSANGDKYVGEWKNGKANGKGTIKLADGDKYVGEFKDNKFSGSGTYYVRNGDKYVGQFKFGKQNGQGTFTYGEGQRKGANYIGEFSDGKYNGQGTFTFPNGSKYVGEYKDGLPNGSGIEYAADGSITAQGIYENGKLTNVETAPLQASVNAHRVQMIKEGGTYIVPVLINEVLTLHFVVDSGAADVTIPADVALTLIRTGTIKEGDFIGSQKYQLADGSLIDSAQFTIRSLKVGDQIVENVRASISGAKGSLLLGQSFLEKFKSWSMDNTSHELVLE